ncbi:MAG: AraC family transcriptional regulator [Tannerella sp.]|jgi:AraC-like DNA-binding protein|nr:AraC family transcriptional regulator [Tannerella sp.]
METIADGFRGEKAIVTPYNIRNLQAANAITQQLYVTHIGYYPNAKYHYRERTGGAAENILIYCEKGKGWIECQGERYRLGPHQMFIIPEKTPHIYGSDAHAPWSIYWIHFRGNNARMFDSVTGRIVTIGESASSRYRDRFMLFESMFENLEMGYNMENLEYISFCLMYFLASVKYLSQYREIRNVKVGDAIQQSIIYMKDNLENRITLDDIAGSVGYSTSHFVSIFTRKTSFSPIEYYNQLRIQKACSLLQFSDLKIKEISFRLGFYDPFHFSKAFVKEMEISPREYRRRYQEIGRPFGSNRR